MKEKKKRVFNATFIQRESEAACKFQRNQNTHEKKSDADE
jgi:hypothetical protein